MELLDWTAILVIIASLISAHYIFKSAQTNQSVTYYLFLVSVVLLLCQNLLFLLDVELQRVDVHSWFKLLILITISAGLFSLTRDLKPKFSKFPLYLVFIPFITLLFYPLIMDVDVISDLIIASYQGGCVAVGILLFGISHHKSGNNLLQILGCVIMLAAFGLFWFWEIPEINETALTELLMSTGMLSISIGINKSNENE